MRINLCGTVSIEGPAGRSEVSRPQVQLCLAALVLERHRPLTREELAHTLWGEGLPSHWPGALRGVLAKLRQAFRDAGCDGDPLKVRAGLVTLELPEVEIDIDTARRAAHEASLALADGRLAHATASAALAKDILAGRFLVAVDAGWADDRRFELEELSRRSCRLLAQARMEAGMTGEALPVLRALAETDPYDEQTQALMLRCVADLGGGAEIRRTLDRYREVLRRDLGVEPSPWLTELAEELIGSAERRVPRAGAKSSVPSPQAPQPSSAQSPFVGRTGELRRISGIADRRLSPAGAKVIVITGEPGIGKTRLAEEWIRAASGSGSGTSVIWGRCHPVGQQPFEPVREAVGDALRRDRDPGEVLDGLTALGLGITETSTSGPSTGTATADASTLATALGGVLRRLAAPQLIWVLDDGQWMDPDTAVLVARCLNEVADEPVTLVVTTRREARPVPAMLAGLGRRIEVHEIDLEGLLTDDLASWIAELQIPSSAETAERLAQRTAGNPLFVREILATASRDRQLDPDSIPGHLAETIGRQIRALDPDSSLLLAACAVCEYGADLEFLSEITMLDVPALLTAATRLGTDGFLAGTSGHLQVHHSIVREVVLREFGELRVAWIHARAGAVLASRPQAPGDAARTAHHLGAAGPAHGDEARYWQLQAAREANDRFAWDGAATLAREILSAPAADPDHRAGALVEMGRALRGSGDRPSAEQTLTEALSVSDIHGLRRRFAEAVLAIVGGGGRGVPDAARYRHADLVERALMGLGPGDDDLRIPLLGTLAVSLLLTEHDERRREAADRALDLARGHDNQVLMARALLDHRFALGPESCARRLREIDEALALAERHQMTEVRTCALVYKAEDLLTAGDGEGFSRTLARARRSLRDHPDPFWEWSVTTWQVIGHVLAGELQAAEATAEEAFSLAADGAWARACLGVNLVLIRAFQGRCGEVVDLLAAAAEEEPHIPCYRAVLAFAALESGDRDRAADELEFFASRNFANIPDDTNRLLALAMSSEVVVGLGAEAHARRLRALLQPYEDCHVLLNCYGGGGAVWGPVSAQLAGLAALEGDPAAAGWRRDAERACARAGDQAFAARMGLRTHTTDVL